MPDDREQYFPGSALGMAAQAAFADPAKRQDIAQWHREGVPLAEMLFRLNLMNHMSEDELRVIVNLTDQQVTTIREVMLARLDSGTDELGIDCTLTRDELNGAYKATVSPEGGAGARQLKITNPVKYRAG